MSDAVFPRPTVLRPVRSPLVGLSILKRGAHSAATLSRRLGWATIIAAAGTTNAFAQASGGTSPAAILTNICNFILGPFGQSLAVLGIIAIGLSWMFGRASLGLIAGVVGGIVLMFGASFLARTLIGG